VRAATFGALGTLAGADISPGPFATAFVRVSPDGTRIAVGNNGGASFKNHEVGIFTIDGLSGEWFSAAHYKAAWIDDRHLALSAGEFGQPAFVTALDTVSIPATPVNPTLVDNIGGAPSGIAFDVARNLYTGNGFRGAGPSETGSVKGLAANDWQAAHTGGPVVDFEVSGQLIVDALSADALGFDAEGNLHVGGGDLFGSSDGDYAALVRASSVLSALAGGPAADTTDPAQVRRLDPDSASSSNFYDVNFNAATGELYLREGTTVYSFVVPEPSPIVLIVVGLLYAVRRSRRLEGQSHVA
jgi:hypothetical protein